MAVSQSFLATGLRQNENYPSGSRVDPVYLGAHLEINGPVRLFRMRWERQYRRKDWEEGNQEINLVFLFCCLFCCCCFITSKIT